jgi:hypothetical protein
MQKGRFWHPFRHTFPCYLCSQEPKSRAFVVSIDLVDNMSYLLSLYAMLERDVKGRFFLHTPSLT